MRKTLTILTVLIILFNNFIIAQTNNNKDDKLCVKQGQFILDAYYGFPYLLGSYIKKIANTNFSDVQVTNFNHLGGKFEYMLNNTIGLGIEYTYASVVAKYTETQTVYQNGANTSVINNYTAKIIKQRMLAKISIHFATTKHLDPYTSFGLGYKNSLVSSDNMNNQAEVDEFNKSYLNLIPIAIRAGIGLRYYFLDNFGLCAEAGIGGPIVQVGLTGKF